MLRQHDALFLLSGAHCMYVNTSLDLADHSETEGHEHKNKSNKHGHDEQLQIESHSETVANYKYRSMNVTSLSSIEVSLFDTFPGIHEIRAMWVKQTQQGAATLTRNNNIIKFR